MHRLEGQPILAHIDTLTESAIPRKRSPDFFTYPLPIVVSVIEGNVGTRDDIQAINRSRSVSADYYRTRPNRGPLCCTGAAPSSMTQCVFEKIVCGGLQSQM